MRRPTLDAWKQIGFNLDGKVTTATSMDVCELVAGANPAAQDDGQDGIDNSFGKNFCPILDSLDESACSTGISQTYVVTDASGSGTVTIQLAPRLLWKIPITDAHVVLNGDGSAGRAGVRHPLGRLELRGAAVQCDLRRHKFWDATPLDGGLPDVPDACPSD